MNGNDRLKRFVDDLVRRERPGTPLRVEQARSAIAGWMRCWAIANRRFSAVSDQRIRAAVDYYVARRLDRERQLELIAA